MPRLWTKTIAGHREDVRDAVLTATAELVARDGLLAVTMSEIADSAGVGRATLYKYFPDVEAILLAWHERQISHHLDELRAARDRSSRPLTRLRAVLTAYARIAAESHGHADTELAALLHRDSRVVRARQHLLELLRDVLADAARARVIRSDVAADELAAYCFHALAAASGVRSQAGLRRLAALVVDALTAGNNRPRRKRSP